jgi:nucleotide-binding universal stress UspA family protein
MKKFIAAFDSLSFSQSTLEYAIYLTKHSHAHLVGVFLEDISRRSYSMSDAVKYAGPDLEGHLEKLDEKDDEKRDESIDTFTRACENADVNFSVHRDRNVALQEMLHESVYADLVIISPDETVSRFLEPVPTRFIRDLLNDIQCPVVLVPPKFKPINKVILLYNGDPSSVYAVRSFSYLFDRMKLLNTEMVTVKEPEDSDHLPDNRLMKEFAKRHYPKASYIVLKGLPEDEVIRYLQREKKDPMVVLGAYRRSKVSRMFRKSMADQLLQHVPVPLFIAHNKS